VTAVDGALKSAVRCALTGHLAMPLGLRPGKILNRVYVYGLTRSDHPDDATVRPEGCVRRWAGWFMAGTPEGSLDQWPFEQEPSEFDAIIGLPLEPGKGHPRRSPDSQVYVSVSGDALSASWAMGLENDVKLLALAFAAGGAKLAHELTRGRLRRSSGRSRKPEQREDVAVAVHGLNLDPRDEEELCDLIRMLVEKRIEDEGRRP